MSCNVSQNNYNSTFLVLIWNENETNMWPYFGTQKKKQRRKTKRKKHNCLKQERDRNKCSNPERKETVKNKETYRNCSKQKLEGKNIIVQNKKDKEK